MMISFYHRMAIPTGRKMIMMKILKNDEDATNDTILSVALRKNHMVVEKRAIGARNDNMIIIDDENYVDGHAPPPPLPMRQRDHEVYHNHLAHPHRFRDRVPDR